jgi:uncharacterized membrane protein
MVAWVDPRLVGAWCDPFVDNSWLIAAVIIMTAAYLATVVLLMHYLKRTISSANMLMFLSFSLLLVQPIFAFAPFDGLYYLGYVTPSNLYIIPTQTLLKLTTIAVFMLTPLLLKRSVAVKWLVLIGLLVIANGLSKPNYLIIMLPALAVLVGLESRKKHDINYSVFAVMQLSCLLVLAWQYYFKFINPDHLIYQSSIALTLPFDVMSHLSGYVPAKILLSIVFPLYVATAFRREAGNDLDTVYAWILFGFGLLYAIFLSETGHTKFAGNFIWSAEIGNFVLFAASARLLFTHAQGNWAQWERRTRWGSVIFSIHLLCGVIYYVRSFSHPYL